MRVTGSSFRGEVHERVAYKYADGFPQIHKYGAWLVRRVPALEIEGLTKAFGGLTAVDDLRLAVQRGEIYGFLGPNGAGKTTTIKMILGLTYPDRGRVRIGDRDLLEDPHAIKRRIGFLPERVAFYNNLTAIQTLRFYAELKRVEDGNLAGLLEAVGLQEFADKKVGTFSKGMVQLLGVAQAMIGEPDLLILDEPTSGLDPNWTRMVKDRIREANGRGATVFFSSHILSEVQELAGRVGIISRGRLVAEDTVDNLGRSLNLKPRLGIVVEGSPADAAAALAGMGGVEAVEVRGTELWVTCDHDAKVRVLSRLEAAGVRVRDFRTEEPSLEEVFLRYTAGTRGAVR